MTYEGLVEWFGKTGGTGFDWSNRDDATLIKGFDHLQNKYGDSKWEDRVSKIIRKRKFLDTAAKDSTLKGWVRDANEEKVLDIQSMFEKATSTRSLKLIYNKAKKDMKGFEDESVIDDLYEEMVDSFDKEEEEKIKEVRSELRSLAKNIDSVKTIDGLDRLGNKLHDLSESIDLKYSGNGGRKDIFGRDMERKRNELAQKEEE